MWNEKNISNVEKREIACARAVVLKSQINDYLLASADIETGWQAAEMNLANKQRILDYFGASEGNWHDWHWQMQHRIKNTDQLAQIIYLNDTEMAEIKKVATRFRWSISPYYASLLAGHDRNCPIRMQSVPNILEYTDSSGFDDPMAEEYTSPAPGITRRYPDRLIINVTNRCAMYCRHCQRRRNIGEMDRNTSFTTLKAALKYIRANKEIRDVLLTGGDALLLSDQELDWLLSELDQIPHVEIKRIGTRAIVTMPQRITQELCTILEKHPPLYINTQFNHPKEVTPEAAQACTMLSQAGVVLGNQAVLLKGINNNPHIMKKLNQELLKIRVRPYYIFQAKTVTGTAHFITKIEEGLEIMEQLRGYTSGLAVPTYIINAPDGYGKTPMLPEYLVSQGSDYITIRTWENKVMQYPNNTVGPGQKSISTIGKFA